MRSEWVTLAGSAQMTAEQAYRMALANARRNNERALLENWQAQNSYKQQATPIPQPLLDLQLMLETEKRSLDQASRETLR